MRATITTENTEELRRIVRTDDVFSLLWEIKEDLISFLDCGEKKIITDIVLKINESGLLELWR